MTDATRQEVTSELRDCQDWKLTVAVRLKQDGPAVEHEPVGDDDLIEPRSEAWLEGILRQGYPQLALDQVPMQIEPVRSSNGSTNTGYRLITTDPAGVRRRCEFSLRSLEGVASRVAQRLIARGQLRPQDLYYFELLASRAAAGQRSREEQGREGRRSTLRVRSLAPLDVEIGPLLDSARHVGTDNGSVKVFYTETSLARAAACSRRGARSHPPVESGGVLVGPLCSCPSTGDLFVFVVEVIEALDAREGEFSLLYSSKTWARIQAVMNQFQANPATRGHRIVGQCHGHNFIPGDGAPPCEACPRLPVCTRSSVFVSQEDINWSRAVFRRQPWHLSHVFGLNARREEVDGLFGQRDSRLLQKGYYVVDDSFAQQLGLQP